MVEERALRSPLFWAGLAVWFSGLAIFFALWVVDRTNAIAAATTLGVFLVAGKVVAITTGLSLGGHPFWVGTAVFFPDFGGLLFFYPLTRVGVDYLGKWSRRIREGVERARQKHERQEGFIARHGAWGLFVIALLPVGFYSPLVISAIGQLLGLRARNVVAAVGSAMFIMTTFWVVALAASVEVAKAFDRRLPIAISLVLLVLFVGKDLVRMWLRRRRAARERAAADAASGPER